jgi:hypothetical protein
MVWYRAARTRAFNIWQGDRTTLRINSTLAILGAWRGAESARETVTDSLDLAAKGGGG